jgi:predicted porin
MTIMQKILLRTAILALASASAFAQSTVNIYGVADAGFVAERGGVAGPVNKISSGVGSVSRLGFKGTENLGDGLSAFYILELGAKIDTGEIDAAGTIFNRQALVGLKSNSVGALSLGRQYTPYYVTLGVADPFGMAYAGNIQNLFPTGGSNTRASNTVLYVSPSVQGMSVELAYSLGEQTGSSTAGRQFGAAIAYASGPLNVRFGYNNHNNDVVATGTSRELGTNAILAANYDLGVLRLYAAYGRDKGPNSAPLPNSGNPYGGVKPTASTDSAEMLIGATVPAGPGTFITSYIRKDDRTSFDQDASQIGVAYSYPLSKRTNLYAAYARIQNRNGAGYTVGNNGEAGSGNVAYNLGMRHSF